MLTEQDFLWHLPAYVITRLSHNKDHLNCISRWNVGLPLECGGKWCGVGELSCCRGTAFLGKAVLHWVITEGFVCLCRCSSAQQTQDAVEYCAHTQASKHTVLAPVWADIKPHWSPTVCQNPSKSLRFEMFCSGLLVLPLALLLHMCFFKLPYQYVKFCRLCNAHYLGRDHVTRVRLDENIEYLKWGADLRYLSCWGFGKKQWSKISVFVLSLTV